MVDLKEWDNEERKRNEEVFYSLLDRLKRGEKISLLDFAPEYREILRGRTYGLWIPPGDIQTMVQKPLTNLASMLDRGMPVPSVLLVPLNLCRSKAEFIVCYGLVPERGGPSYDIFLQEIREGRILPFITEAPTRYKGDFYQEILKACKEGEIQLPPFLVYRIPLFMRWFLLIESAIQEEIPPERGWEDLVLQRHPEYDFDSWEKKARSILSDEMVHVIQKEHPMWDKEDVVFIIATYAYRLSVFGFSSLANLSLKLLRESPLSFNVLHGYNNYLVFGYSEGLGGLMMYDRVDLGNMTFLRIIKNMPKGDVFQEEEFITVSPAGFSVVGTETEIPIVVKFDEDDLKNSLKRERDRELEKHMLDSMRAFQEYDFREFRKKNEAINEIIAERIVKETRGYYRRSKIAEGTIISGGTLTLAAGAIEAYQYLQPIYQHLLPLLPILSPIVYKIISKMIEKMMEKREEAARWLVSRWPFQQKGLPFYLWLHGIRADRIKKALNA
jgi:hypothetical protein